MLGRIPIRYESDVQPCYRAGQVKYEMIVYRYLVDACCVHTRE